ncbi:late competence development ComFB family protein [Peribacillus frigoritolerans]|uniref:late competence development ComFB family protein n=1 Tax=Peribacillus frigoritolerans TaxID=450367 RepID=UPI00105A2E8E|nr:late competence development ComFB family protein [Peribacillus frigoritolerans]TDL78938.1 competence protein ComFB [Peribacillus frigoritolerans]
MVVNAMERIMIDLLYEYMTALQMTCTCEECLNDVLALVLNRVQPRYVTNPEKVAYVKAEFVDKQQMTTLIVNLAECAKMVSDMPRCENYVRGEK